MTILESILLGVVEGATEFLPISSTGHMVLVSHFLKMENSDFLKAFEVIIQFGAILSVLLMYWRKIYSRPELIKFLVLGFIPAGVFGFLLKNKIDDFLESATIVAWSLIVGGVILIIADYWIEKRMKHNRTLDTMTSKDSLLIGFAQTLALIPGVSRSGASIVGALALKYNKQDATEFSFLLALPTLGMATLYKLIKIRNLIHAENILLLFVGSAVAFVIAWISIRFLIHLVSRHGFAPFGYYRIVLGILVLIFS